MGYHIGKLNMCTGLTSTRWLHVHCEVLEIGFQHLGMLNVFGKWSRIHLLHDTLQPIREQLNKQKEGTPWEGQQGNVSAIPSPYHISLFSNMFMRMQSSITSITPCARIHHRIRSDWFKKQTPTMKSNLQYVNPTTLLIVADSKIL